MRVRLILFRSFILFIILPFAGVSCSGTGNFLSDNGENIILTDETCLGADCDAESLEPLIDYTDNIPDDGVDIDNVDVDNPDGNVNEDTETCDSSTDKDGDGVPCPCDENDNTAWKHQTTTDCDADGDAIPSTYDLCPNHNDTDDVIVVHLCDSDEAYSGIFSEVDYDDTRWDESTCGEPFAANFVYKTQMDETLDTDVIANKFLINFPVLYVYPDENQNGRPDGCDLVINKNPDFGPWAGE